MARGPGRVATVFVTALESVALLAPAWLAAAIDVRTRRIPNVISVVGLVLALLIAWRSASLVDASLGAGLGLLTGVVIAIAARGAFGGGDVKLLAYGGAAVGVARVPIFLFGMSLAGGVIAVAAVMAHRRRDLTIPYGPAIAVGCSLALLIG